jgi:pyrimidine-nucleoside phosphorylase
MVDIGKGVGRRVAAVISDMSQPLGQAVGNALETLEAFDTLRGQGPPDFVEHCLVVAEHMLVLGGRASSIQIARGLLLDALESGRALEKAEQWITAQGGDVKVLDDPKWQRSAAIVRYVTSPRDGVIAGIDAMQVGLANIDLGGGRTKKGDPIDHGVGILVGPKVGDRVVEGQHLATILANDEARCAVAQERLIAAYSWSDIPLEPPPLVYKIVD